MQTTRNIKISAETKKCLGCLIHTEEATTIGGLIASSNYFEARQDYAVPIPGFIIIASQRHIRSIAHFSREELGDFIEFVYARAHVPTLGHAGSYHRTRRKFISFSSVAFSVVCWMKTFDNDVSSLRSIMRYAQENFTTHAHNDAVLCAAEKLKKNNNHHA